MNSDSGVVMRMCGGCFAINVRSRCGVSPVRTATRISGSGVPCASASPAMASSGTDKLRCTSFDSAFSGETYTTSVRTGRPPVESRAHQPVDAREKRRQRLARPGRRRDQRVPPLRDGVPALSLRPRRPRKLPQKPLPHQRVKPA